MICKAIYFKLENRFSDYQFNTTFSPKGDKKPHQYVIYTTVATYR
jgi:hypothetical protein